MDSVLIRAKEITAVVDSVLCRGGEGMGSWDEEVIVTAGRVCYKGFDDINHVHGGC